MVLTIGSGLTTANTISIATESITFTCNKDGNDRQTAYPRAIATDPAANPVLAQCCYCNCSNTDTFTINVGKSPAMINIHIHLYLLQIMQLKFLITQLQIVQMYLQLLVT